MADETKLENVDTKLKSNDANVKDHSRSPTGKSLPTTTEAMAQQKTAPAPIAKTAKAKRNQTAGNSKSTRNQATECSRTPKKLLQQETLDKKEQVKRLEKEIQGILLWKRPSRSGAYFILIMAGLILSKSYSVIEMVSAFLTIAIGVNLIYVTFTIQIQRILADRPGVNPYSALLQNGKITTINQNVLQHYTELVADVIEVVFQKTARIVLVEDTAYSIKCLTIFYVVWKLSRLISVRILATLVTFILFSIPLLYKYNKTVVDARIHQAQSACQTHLEQGQDRLQHGWNQICMHFRLKENSQSAPSMAPRTQKSRKEN